MDITVQKLMIDNKLELIAGKDGLATVLTEDMIAYNLFTIICPVAIKIPVHRYSSIIRIKFWKWNHLVKVLNTLNSHQSTSINE